MNEKEIDDFPIFIPSSSEKVYIRKESEISVVSGSEVFILSQTTDVEISYGCKPIEINETHINDDSWLK